MFTLAISERSRWGVFAAAIACALLLPGLAGAGFWDPHELDAVGRAWSALGGRGGGELGLRLPRAIAGVTLAIVAYAWASRASGARVGVVCATLVAASPVIVAASRQVSGAGDLELALGHALFVAGATAIAWPRGWLSFVLGGAAVALGGGVAYAWGGALLGVAVPAAAVAVAAVGRRARLAVVAAASAAIVAALGLAGVASLGPAWATPPREIAWSAGLERIAYGMAPWVALLPAAVARPIPRGDGVREFATTLAIAWVATSVIACSGLTLGVGPARFPAVCGAAFLVALWVDAAAAGRHRPAPGAIVLGALIAAVLARDLAAFPDRLASLAFVDRVGGVVAGGGVGAIPVVVAAVFVTAIVILAAARRKRIARVAAAVAVAACAINAALHVAVWMPAVSRHLSARHLFDRYRAVAAPGEPLAVLSVPPRVSARYAGDARQARRPGDVVELLAGEGRGFAIIGQRALCEVTQTMRARGGAVHVIDDSEVFALVSDDHRPGEPRVPGLEQAISDRAPRPARRIDAVLADGVDIVGVDMPARVRRGASFEMTLYYRVRKPPARRWKVFVHFDGPGGRFQGDHDPLGGRCPPPRWNAGDYIADTFTVRAGSVAHPGGRWRVWVGFFVGSNPNWTNMEVVSGEADGADRVAAGVLEVR